MNPTKAGAVAMLLGPTASGKSAIAMALAETLPIEIVSVDSAQVYREMDIGTAKPGPAERAAVAHHLIDIVDPVERYSAARFVDDARAAIEAIRARGRIPLLVGGTMLYARALAEGLHRLPAADPALRRRLDDEARALGWPALHARLAGVDAKTAARIDPSDAQRIQRALEVLESTGRPLSAWLVDGTREPAALGGPIVRITLEPADRAALHARIATRFRAMIDAGLIDEVRRLRERGDLARELPSMRSVGYRQVWSWLDEGGAREAMVDAGIAATRQLAKRQLTWLRAMRERIAIDPFERGAVERVRRALRAVVDQSNE